MKNIFRNNEIEILRIEGLRFVTDFDNIIKDSTHVPLFDNEQREYYVSMGSELRKFQVNKTQYGFRYYDENGVLSPYWTAIFCQLEGEESECVILARFYQNSDADTLDGCWELPYGCYHPVTKSPRVFYRSPEDFVRDYAYYPSLYRVWDNIFKAYRYNQIENRAEECKVKINAYYYIGSNLHVECADIDEETLFSSYAQCINYNRLKIIESK